MATITGTNNADNLVGTVNADTINGSGGSDYIDGGKGDDVIDGGAGDDILIGGEGDDKLTGGIGNDILYGGPGNNTLDGGDGSDLIWGGSGIDTIFGGTGDDLIYGDGGNDIIDGGAGADIILGGDGADAINGGDGNDTIAGGAGNDTINGGAGIDTVVLQGTRSQYTVTWNAALSQWTVQDKVAGRDGTDLLTSVEYLQFSNGLDALIPPVNHAPTVAAHIANRSTNEDAAFSFVVPATTFADVDAGDTRTYSASRADGTALPTWLTFNAATRTLSGTPLNGDVGVVAVKITVTDSGGLSASDTFNLTVNNTNDAPTVAAPIADQTATSLAAFSFVVPGNTFNDVDVGDTLSYSAKLANGAALPSWLMFNATSRTFTGTPPAATSLNIRVSANDGHGGTIFDDFVLTVANANRPPVAADDSSYTTAEDVALNVVTGGVLANDSDPDGNPLTAALVTGPAHGSLTLNPNGTFSYTPTANYNGVDTFTYRASDGSATSNVATVTINITPVNDAAVIGGVSTATVTEDGATTTASGQLTIADPDAGEAAFQAPATASLTQTYGDFTFNAASGAWTYALDPARSNPLATGQVATDSLTVTSLDGSATRTIQVTINGHTDGSNIDLIALSPTQGFRIDGAAAGDRSGVSTTSAGDINGDGFDDLIVAANLADASGRVDAGSTYVLFGKASGFTNIDLATLTAAQGFRIDGAAAGDISGRAAASAGDVNGDGFADLIIGAPRADPNGRDGAGSSYILFGKASGFTNIDLANPLSAAQGFRIDGAAADDTSGISVASAGDVNGDGYDDVIIGATGVSSDAGASYVVFGQASGFANIDLATMTAAQGFRILGAPADGGLAFRVNSAGDINGDGVDDLIIGAQNADPGGVINAGSTFVLFGARSGLVDINLASGLTPAQGFRINGGASGDTSGWSVSSAGDVNGDGFDDIVIGALLASSGGFSEHGSSFVLFGKASGFGTVNLGALSPGQGFRIDGATTGNRSGIGVSSAGDFNGDGFDDFLIGANGFDPTLSRQDAGATYLIYGKASGFTNINLATLTAAQGFRVDGVATADSSGAPVGAAGDINGDGFDDLIIGATGADPSGRTDAGSSYVLFGGGGSASPVTTTGSGGAEILVGGLAADTLTGGGGADVIRGGAGNDTIIVADLSFARIDGGTGQDTLALSGAGQTLDLASSAFLPERITDIERIDLTGSGNNALRLGRLDVFDLTSERTGGSAIIYVDGNAGDSVTFADAGWTNAGSVVSGSATYDRWVNNGAEVRVSQAVLAPGARIEIGSFNTSSYGGGPGVGSIHAFTDNLALTGTPGDSGGGTNVDFAIGAFTGAAGLPTTLTTSPDWDVYASALLAKTSEISPVGIDVMLDVNRFVFIGGSGDDKLQVDNSSTAGGSMYGGAGNDVLKAGNGADRLVGGAGADTMTGGAGADTFFYASSGHGGDTITDFVSGVDKIEISAAGFGGGLSVGGTVSVTTSASGTAGQFIYDTGSHVLTWDADGAGSAFNPVVIANFTNAPALTASDFVVTSAAAPLVLDLNHDGVSLISGVSFDYNGDGIIDVGSWASPQDAFLALDRNHDGKISGISEISFIGDVAGAASDLDGLKGFDSNGDGRISATDARFADFRIWQDANSDGVAQANEVRGLAASGIVSIGLTRSGDASSTANGDILGYAVVTLADGSTLQAADASLNYASQSGAGDLHTMPFGGLVAEEAAFDFRMLHSGEPIGLTREMQSNATTDHIADTFDFSGVFSLQPINEPGEAMTDHLHIAGADQALTIAADWTAMFPEADGGWADPHVADTTVNYHPAELAGAHPAVLGAELGLAV